MSKPTIVITHEPNSKYIRASLEEWCLFLYNYDGVSSSFAHIHPDDSTFRQWITVPQGSLICLFCNKKMPIHIEFYLRRYLSKVKDYKGALNNDSSKV